MRRVVLGLCLMCMLPSMTWAAVGDAASQAQLIAQHVGFGTVTGGQGGALCTVTSLANSGTNTLRDCATRSGPQWIIFGVSGTITMTESPGILQIGPDKTIDGRGANITIDGAQIWINGDNGQHNIIVHNITFAGNNRALWVIGATYDIWIDHVTLEATMADEGLLVACSTNGSTDAGVTGVTISWSRFKDNPGGSILVGTNNGQACNYQTEITFHHNFYDNSHARLPLSRFAKMHSFNSYMKHTQTCPVAQGLCIGAQATNHAQFISENDIFECANTYCSGHPRVEDTGINEQPFPNTPSDNVKVTGQWSVTGDETYETKNPGTIFTVPYSYTAATANATLQASLLHTTMGAGRVDNPYNYLAASAATQIAWWKFDETSGATTAVDTIGGFTGTLTNMTPSTDWVAGKIGNALNFDGVDGFVATTFTTSLGVDPYSVSVWFKATGTTARTDAIWAKRPSGADQFTLFICGDATCGSDGNRLVIYEGTFPTPSRAAISPGSVLDNAWHLATVTRDATSLILYLDGVEVATTTAAMPTITSTTPLVIGNSNNTVAGDEFLGLLDDMRLYTGVLTSTEVLSLYTAATCTLTPVVATFQDGTTFMFGRNLVTGITPDTVPPHTGSTLRLFQNSLELGPAHSTDGDIQTIGLGRFRHACCGSEAILWSASDNTNVISNGRTYAWTNGCTPDIVAGVAPGAPTHLRVVSP